MHQMSSRDTTKGTPLRSIYITLLVCIVLLHFSYSMVFLSGTFSLLLVLLPCLEEEEEDAKVI